MHFSKFRNVGRVISDEITDGHYCSLFFLCFIFYILYSIIQTLLYFIVFHIFLRSCFFNFPTLFFLTPEIWFFQKLFTSSLIHNFFYLFNSLSFHLSIFIYIISICFSFYKILPLLLFLWSIMSLFFISFGISH